MSDVVKLVELFMSLVVTLIGVLDCGGTSKVLVTRTDAINY